MIGWILMMMLADGQVAIERQPDRHACEAAVVAIEHAIADTERAGTCPWVVAAQCQLALVLDDAEEPSQ